MGGELGCLCGLFVIVVDGEIGVCYVVREIGSEV